MEHQASGGPSATSFKVRTVADFQATSQKRKAKESGLACRMCRNRKVKCVMDGQDDPTSAYQESCLPCIRASLDCTWDREDRRKRPKIQTFTLEQPSKSGKTLDNVSQGQVVQSTTIVGSEPMVENIDGVVDFQSINPSNQDASNLQTQSSNPTRRVNEVPLLGLSPPRPHPTEIMNLNLPSGMENLASIVSGAQGEFPNGQPSIRTPFFSSNSPRLSPSQLQAHSSFEWPNIDDFIIGLDFSNNPEDDFFSGFLVGSKSPGPEYLDQTKQPFSRAVKLRYYRSFGPTAMTPGLRALSVLVESQDQSTPSQNDRRLGSDRSTSDSVSPGFVHAEQSTTSHASSIQDDPMMASILKTFFSTFGGHFPFLHPTVLGGHVQSGEASSFLLNAMAALTMRFCDLEETASPVPEIPQPEWQRGSNYLKRAKANLLPVLNIPSPEVVAGLLTLTMVEFGDNNETGMWMLAGMTIRMAQDLGLHRLPDMDHDNLMAGFHDYSRPSPDGKYVMTDEQSLIHQQKARLVMYWSVFILDVCVSLRMGRPPAIQQRDIEVPIPTIEDMKITQLDFTEEPQMKNLVFPALCRLMLLYAECVEALNSNIRVPDTDETRKERHERLTNLHERLVNTYSELPTTLHLTPENYKEALDSAQSGLLLTLHLYFYTLTTLLTASIINLSLKKTPSSSHNLNSHEILNGALSGHHPSQYLNGLLIHQPDLAILATQKIVQASTIADLLDPNGYLASPFTNHAFFLAASILLRIWQKQQQQQEGSRDPDDEATRPPIFSTSQQTSNPTTTATSHDEQLKVTKTFNQLSSSLAKTDYLFLRDKLKKQSTYFAAIESTIASLDQAELGNGREDVYTTVEKVVDVADPGIVSRYKIP